MYNEQHKFIVAECYNKSYRDINPKGNKVKFFLIIFLLINADICVSKNVGSQEAN